MQIAPIRQVNSRNQQQIKQQTNFKGYLKLNKYCEDELKQQFLEKLRGINPDFSKIPKEILDKIKKEVLKPYQYQPLIDLVKPLSKNTCLTYEYGIKTINRSFWEYKFHNTTTNTEYSVVGEDLYSVGLSKVRNNATARLLNPQINYDEKMFEVTVNCILKKIDSIKDDIPKYREKGNLDDYMSDERKRFELKRKNLIEREKIDNAALEKFRQEITREIAKLKQFISETTSKMKYENKEPDAVIEMLTQKLEDKYRAMQTENSTLAYLFDGITF